MQLFSFLIDILKYLKPQLGEEKNTNIKNTTKLLKQNINNQNINIHYNRISVIQKMFLWFVFIILTIFGLFNINFKYEYLISVNICSYFGF